ncbi:MULTISPECIES: hypothetical protein [unclassified Streptomyces]|uniref:hypothetical protein n=1 Tax=unclassified Streptomyces TaxID=2593676 RepID=UPI002E77982E|nr:MULTISPECIES: hypothetical protein [unclassified Streptomyces]MEE1760537.1 hypothetical protein [Streptomyces sp. SP18BB07]MEE1833235.1 hypothetical protein [Streptomyces sp. SP17KL33]
MGTEPRTDTGSSPEEPAGRTMGNKYVKEFMRVVHVSLRSWWWGEPLAATSGGLGGAWIGHDDDLPMDEVLGVAVSMVGVVIGSVFAVLAMITRACDNTFLRRARKARLLPVVNYLWPFFTIIGMGILSIVFLLLMAGISEDAPTLLLMTVSASAGFCVLWTLAGLLPALGALIVFTRLIEKTSGVND